MHEQSGLVRRSFSPVFFFVLVATLATATSAQALPQVGARVSDARVQDPDGRVLNLRSSGGKPTLIIHEDNHSGKQNDVLKGELIRLGRENRGIRNSLRFAAIADVSEFDYWPARDIAADTIRERARATGEPIYSDWKGVVRKAYGLHRGQSSIVFVGKDGRVRFAAEGPLREEQRAQLLEMLREELGSVG